MNSSKNLPCGITGTLMREEEEKPSKVDIDVPMGKDCCPCFVVFLRILLLYLRSNSESKKAYTELRKKVIECTEKARRQEPGYECVAEAVLREIPSIVREADLRKVQALVQARAQRKKKASTSGKNEAMNSPSVCAKFNFFEHDGPTASV
jgi:hypothetical protein